MVCILNLCFIYLVFALLMHVFYTENGTARDMHVVLGEKLGILSSLLCLTHVSKNEPFAV